MIYSFHWYIFFATISMNYSVLCDSSDFVSVPEMIVKEGYPVELHNVTTEDGYILAMHRIKGGNNKTPVLLMAGLMCDAGIWCALGRGKALPFLLADLGYDVWIGNSRGIYYHMTHENSSISPAKYWDFTFHEVGTYDIPAIIDYITNFKNVADLFYIGHSQGTLVTYIMLSMKPNIAKKIRLMMHLSPVAYVTHTKGILTYTRPILYFLNFMRVHVGFPNTIFIPSATVKFIIKYGCLLFNFEEYTCLTIMFSIIGFDYEQTDLEIVPKIFGSYPLGGSSIKNIIHFCQYTKTEKFNQFDYGEKKNLEHYNQTTPPLYDLSKADVPIFLYYSENDYLATPSDVEKLFSQLPNLVGKIKLNKFNHLDFLCAQDAKKLVYDHIIGLMKSYEN